MEISSFVISIDILETILIFKNMTATVISKIWNDSAFQGTDGNPAVVAQGDQEGWEGAGPLDRYK